MFCPPYTTAILIDFLYFVRRISSFAIWSANSLVGARIRDVTLRSDVSVFSTTGIPNEHVLPVPVGA